MRQPKKTTRAKFTTTLRRGREDKAGLDNPGGRCTCKRSRCPHGLSVPGPCARCQRAGKRYVHGGDCPRSMNFQRRITRRHMRRIDAERAAAAVAERPASE